MKKILLIILVLFAVVSPSICYAEGTHQPALSLEELTIQVMPEFAYHPNDQEKDHAPLLIGYHGSMINNSEQPQIGQIEIPLPMNDPGFRIGYIADYSADLKQVYEIEYAVDKDRGTISWTTSEEISPKERYKFVVEYYTDSLKVDGAKKSLAYQFKSFVDIGLVNVNFLQPNKAKDMKLSPKPEEQSHGDGKDTYAYHFQDVKAGDQKSFKLTYQRSEKKTTIELLSIEKNVEEKSDKKINYLAVGTFGGVSLVSVGALSLLIRRNRKQAR
ncbi:hypothetical protein [Bacillus sp. FJAT-29814]|uniref:hypothetical protein n=1 Tax=Bacillus sp. FJAT-29814 TaxID=1729688 RepID=UPI000830AB98|nr:hypothetical protein [Bacillus sp. FJAT-29814]